MDWTRWHIFDLAVVCKRSAENHTLSADQRNSFAAAYVACKPLTMLPDAGGHANR